MNAIDLEDDSSSQMPFVGVLIQGDRVEEGLRMASALSLCDNEVEVILLGKSLPNSADVDVHLDSLDIEEIPVRATFDDSRVQKVTWEEINESLGGYDHVLTF